VRPIPVANPPNPFRNELVEYFEAPLAELTVFEDATRTVLSENDSPDIGFRYGLNPYRGCGHGCAYCYARPSHEYLGFGAGTDFERKIVVKSRAPELLRETFDKRSWHGELIVFSGNTDCYQPIEAAYGLTRRCLEVCAAYRNPVHVITKSALIERDLDVLAELAGRAELGVTLSIPFLSAEVARAIEPYAPTPQRRLLTLRRLSALGIRTSVNVAPLIPGLNDRDVVGILEAARDAGASGAGLVALRLPGSVAAVFGERIQRDLPLSAGKILKRTREMRGGRLNDPRFGKRMQGEGEYIAAVTRLFRTTAERLGLDTGMTRAPLRSTFCRPPGPGQQLELFRRV
jgi:DNA repair photolyase